MKKLNLNELGKNILKRNNNSNLSNILNKGTLNQTRTTDYSISSQDVSLNNIKPKENEKNKKIKSKPLINIQTPDDEIKKLNKKRSHPNLNTSKKILPTNVNDFYHLIYDNLFGNYESINWIMGLRLANTNNLKNLNSKKMITEPSFYQQDSKKFSEKMAKDVKPILNELNPNLAKFNILPMAEIGGA